MKNADIKINALNFLFTLNAPSSRARLITDRIVFTCRSTRRRTEASKSAQSIGLVTRQDGHKNLAAQLQNIAAEEGCEAEDVCRHPEVEQPRDQGELGGGEAEAGEQQVLAGVGAEAGTRRIFAAFWCIFKLISWGTGRRLRPGL